MGLLHSLGEIDVPSLRSLLFGHNLPWYRFLKDAPFVLLCKLFRRKIVIHQHNKGMSRDVERWPYRWLMPWIYRNTKVILLSWRLYPDIKKIVEKDQILICSNGIPDTLQEELEAKRNNRIPHLLFLSNLMVSKGVIVLLDALEILKIRIIRLSAILWVVRRQK